MKNIKIIIILILSIGVFSACVDNELPSFDDNEAFASFSHPSATLSENQAILDGESEGIIRIPVVAASVEGITGTVDFEMVDSLSNAIEGDNFQIVNESKTLHFSKDNRVDYIDIKAVDNDEFGGDRSLKIVLTNPQGLQLGAEKSFDLTIVDDEHPLAFILGDKTIYATSDFDGDVSWDITIQKDENDLSKVWIKGLVNWGDIQAVYGVINEDKTEIKIPVGQVTQISSSYPKIILAAFEETDTERSNPLKDGFNIKGTISEDGVITLHNAYGSLVYSDEAMSDELGWWDLYYVGAQIK